MSPQASASFITCATSFISSHSHCCDTISRAIISQMYFGRIFFIFLNLCVLDLRQRNFSISVEHSPLCVWCTELIPFCWVEKCVCKEPWHFNQPNYLSLTSCSPPRAFIYLSEIVRPGWGLLFFFNSVCLEWEFLLCPLERLSALSDLARSGTCSAAYPWCICVCVF